MKAIKQMYKNNSEFFDALGVVSALMFDLFAILIVVEILM